VGTVHSSVAPVLVAEVGGSPVIATVPRLCAGPSTVRVGGWARLLGSSDPRQAAGMGPILGMFPVWPPAKTSPYFKSLILYFLLYMFRRSAVF
jgi:hypothetical protein